MRFRDWLDVTEALGLYFVVYHKEDNENDEPMWSGKYMEIPHWIAKYKLAAHLDGMPAIDYRSSLGEQYGNNPGFVVIVED